MSKLKIPKPDLQITFYHRLQKIRHTYLLDALRSTVVRLDITEIDRQLALFAPKSGIQLMAGWGLRGEVISPVPCVLEDTPRLLGYYRLLFGFSQKELYGTRYGLGAFKSMEEHGRLSPRNASRVKELCQALCRSGDILVGSVNELSQETIHELTLLTLGPQLRGGALNVLGNKATRRVFDLIHSLLVAEVIAEGKRSLELQNAAGRLVKVEFAPDPDICIQEELPSGKFRNLVAIEIKGGRDYSNIHNRIGEAEKSHQKARKEGYVECWTMVGVSNLDMDVAQKESPTTDRFYHIDRIADPNSTEAEDFRENLLARIGI